MATAVIIPVRNRALLLGKAIASVQKQTCQVDEIIVVDDGSTDDTVVAATQLSRQDSRIRVVVLAKNIGASAARNAGIDATECDWIASLIPTISGCRINTKSNSARSPTTPTRSRVSPGFDISGQTPFVDVPRPTKSLCAPSRASISWAVRTG